MDPPLWRGGVQSGGRGGVIVEVFVMVAVVVLAVAVVGFADDNCYRV